MTEAEWAASVDPQAMMRRLLNGLLPGEVGEAAYFRPDRPSDRRLVFMSEMADFVGLPVDGWAVREMLAHPLSQLLWWASLCGVVRPVARLSDWCHDATVPTHAPHEGRG